MRSVDKRKIMSKEIEKLIDAEEWKAARKLIRAALRNEPDCHWLITRLGLTYYEERKYRKALYYDTKATPLRRPVNRGVRPIQSPPVSGETER
jgi:hypothetical protein